MPLRKALALLAVVALLGTACGDDSGGDDPGRGDVGQGGAEQGIQVTAEDFAFDQASLAVEPGEEVDVSLENLDDAEHSFTVDELDFDIEAGGGDSAEGTLTASEEDATFEFYCRYHPNMTGELVVGAGGTGAGGGGDTGEGEKENDDGTDTDY